MRQGSILCRLEQRSDAMHKLRQKLTCGSYSRSSSPLFYTNLGRKDGKLHALHKTDASFLKTENEPFQINIEFCVGNIDEPIGIYLGNGDGTKETSALISGFPCSLVQLKKLHHSKFGTKITLRTTDTLV